jgi:hypothetical protein
VEGWLIALAFAVAALALAVQLLAPLAFRRLQIARQGAVIRQAFAAYVSPKVINQMIRDPLQKPKGPERRDVSFILFQVRDDDAENVQKQLERALPIVTEGGGVILDMMSSLVLAVFGLFPGKEPGVLEDNRALVAARLMSELGADIRLVHGSSPGLVGNFGTGARINYDSVLPKFGKLLERLLKLDYGQSAEISPAVI